MKAPNSVRSRQPPPFHKSPLNRWRSFAVTFLIVGVGSTGIKLATDSRWWNAFQEPTSQTPEVGKLFQDQSTTNSVRIRPKTSPVWADFNTQERTMRAGEAIFTGDQANANLTFDDGTQLFLYENTLILVELKRASEHIQNGILENPLLKALRSETKPQGNPKEPPTIAIQQGSIDLEPSTTTITPITLIADGQELSVTATAPNSKVQLKLSKTEPLTVRPIGKHSKLSVTTRPVPKPDFYARKQGNPKEPRSTPAMERHPAQASPETTIQLADGIGVQVEGGSNKSELTPMISSLETHDLPSPTPSAIASSTPIPETKPIAAPPQPSSIAVAKIEKPTKAIVQKLMIQEVVIREEWDRRGLWLEITPKLLHAGPIEWAIDSRENPRAPASFQFKQGKIKFHPNRLGDNIAHLYIRKINEPESESKGHAIHYRPEAPVAQNPIHNSSKGRGEPVFFTWKKLKSGESVEFQLWTGSHCKTPVETKRLADNYLLLKGLSPGNYCWGLRKRTLGAWSNPSDLRTLTITAERKAGP